MLARLNVGKLHTSGAIAAISLLGLLVDCPSIAPQKTYDDLQARQLARQSQYLPTLRSAVESQVSASEQLNAPRRLDLLAGASGQPIDVRNIFVLSSPIGDGFGRLIPHKNGFGLEVKEPAGTWTRLPVVHFDKSLVLMRHGKDCVRLEDPVEPTANYYAICMALDGITIHTVGDVESFS